MRRILPLIGLVLNFHLVLSQEEFNLTELRAPSSPAFTIMGNQPNEIASPKSWADLEASLYSSFFNNSTSPLLPTNYALEFSPYWMKHNQLSFEEFADPGFGQSLLQNLSVSIASQKDNPDSSATSLGTGVRFLIDFSKPSDELLKESRNLENSQSAIVLFNMVCGRLLTESVPNMDSLKNRSSREFSSVSKIANPPDVDVIQNLRVLTSRLIQNLNDSPDLSPESIIKIKDEIIASYDKEAKVEDIAERVEKAIKENEGFKVEFAIASKLRFPTNEIKDGSFQKIGFWVTPSYTHSKTPFLEILGVLRVIRNTQDIPTNIEKYESQGFQANSTMNYDAGGKLVFQNDQFSLSTELIYRNQSVQYERIEPSGIRVTTSSEKPDFKWNLSANYKISNKMVLTYTYGQNFDINTEINGNLISVLSLNFGFGAPNSGDITP